MKKSIVGIAGLGLLTGGLLFGFQNCSSGSLPDVSTQASLAVAPTPTEIKLSFSPSMDVDSSQTIIPTGGTAPYTFMLTSGPGSIGLLTGAYSSGATGGSAVIMVADSLGQQQMASILVNSPVPKITAGTITVTSAQSFAVPAFNTLTIEVYGGGGGGGALTAAKAAGGYATAGQPGGTSSVTGGGLNISAYGGGAGNPGGVNYADGAPGDGGGAVGGVDVNTAGSAGSGPQNGGAAAGPEGGAGGVSQARQDGGYYSVPGTAPGGGGSAFGLSQGNYRGFAGGGGGGGYAKTTISAQASLPIDTKLQLVVGAGGLAGLDGPRNPQAGVGAVGKIKITWQ